VDLTVPYPYVYSKSMSVQSLEIHLKLTSLFHRVKYFAGLVAATIASFIMFTSPANAAGPASLSLSPNNSGAKAGSDLIIKVHLNTGGQSVNAVQADITYPLSIFYPSKSSAKCANQFSTKAQNAVNGTINVGGTKMGLAKIACAVTLNGNEAAPFSGESDIAVLKLHVRATSPPIHSDKMLSILVDNDLSDGHNNYSQVARASDSANVLGSVSPAAVTISTGSKSFKGFDVNNDNVLDSGDINILVNRYGKSPSNQAYAKADINGDHKINAIDLSILLSNLL
jgi:hypothetical protein